MKGFPNQLADLTKIGIAVSTLIELVEKNADAKDDGVFGEALVRSGVAGTGHAPRPIELYISQQLQKSPDRQSFRTTARGLRELFRLLALIDESSGRVEVTALGRQAARYSRAAPGSENVEFWRRVIRDMAHSDGLGNTSHPYQMLLRLVARAPGITRAKCALALEARNDSEQELDRIVSLAQREESEICRSLGITKSNWDNAKKVLPKFAEQLGDVIRNGQSFTLAVSPGGADQGPAVSPEQPNQPPTDRVEVRAPRNSREVTPEKLGAAGTVDQFDEARLPTDLDPAATQAAVNQRLQRWGRHNDVLRTFGARLAGAGARLFVDRFDLLALIHDVGFLVEAKSLDGTPRDERDRVMEALSQLLYYEAFVAAPYAGESVIQKIACFENRITEAHQRWLNQAGIGSMWALGNNRFGGDRLAATLLGDYIEELR